MSDTNQNDDTNIITNGQDPPGTPQKRLGTIGELHDEKYLCTTISSFARDFFSSFRMFAPLARDIFQIFVYISFREK